MLFNKLAQELIVVDSDHENAYHHDHNEKHNHNHEHAHTLTEIKPIIPSESIHIVVTDPLQDEVPGARNAEPLVEVSDEESSSEIQKADDNEDRKPKKNEKWDWESKGAIGFIAWVKDRLENIPRHSGMDTAGLERAISYLEKIDSEISKAMRLDLDGELDGDKIEEVRSKIDDGLERLDDRLKKLKKKKKTKKAEEDDDNLIVKEAQKITGVKGVFVTVPLLVSRIARVCVNGMVSGGHDIEDMFNKQAEYYNLNNRERAEVIQLLSDMGYALKQDRGFLPEDSLEVFDNGMDFSSNYRA